MDLRDTTNANLYHLKGDVFGLLIYVAVSIFVVSSSKSENNSTFGVWRCIALQLVKLLFYIF